MTVTIYGKPFCVQCKATYRALDRRKILYNIIDISEDTRALSYVQSLGYRQAPVIVAGDVHWSGFRPDLIDRIG